MKRTRQVLELRKRAWFRKISAALLCLCWLFFLINWSFLTCVMFGFINQADTKPTSLQQRKQWQRIFSCSLCILWFGVVLLK